MLGIHSKFPAGRILGDKGDIWTDFRRGVKKGCFNGYAITLRLISSIWDSASVMIESRISSPGPWLTKLRSCFSPKTIDSVGFKHARTSYKESYPYGMQLILPDSTTRSKSRATLANDGESHMACSRSSWTRQISSPGSSNLRWSASLHNLLYPRQPRESVWVTVR